MLGPFVDKTDGVTAETGLAGNGTELSKAGAAFGAGPTLGTHDSDGWYPITLTTTHTNTLGDLMVKSVDDATHLPVWTTFTVVPAIIYDSLFATAATDYLPVDVVQIAGAAVSASTAQLGVNVVQAAGTAWGSGAITAAAVADGAIDAATFAAGAINAAAIADAAIDFATFAADCKTGAGLKANVESISADAITADAIADAAVEDIADAVWDEAMSGHTALGSFGLYVSALPVNPFEMLVTSPPTPGTYNATLTNINTNVNDIETDTQDIQSRLPAALTAAGNIKADVKAINAVGVTGTGVTGDSWGPSA
jgi:hypothetical protein